MSGSSLALLSILSATLLISGCSKTPEESAIVAAAPHEVVDLDEDLAQLKADFNAAVDQLRLVFIVGPT